MRDYVMVDGRLHWVCGAMSYSLHVEPVPSDGTEPRWVPCTSATHATLTEVLTGLGYTTFRPNCYPVDRLDVLRDGVVVFTGRTWEVWEWLKEVHG